MTIRMTIRTPLQVIKELHTLLVEVGDDWSPGYDTVTLVKERQRLYGVKFSGDQYNMLLALAVELYKQHEHAFSRDVTPIDEAVLRLRGLLVDAEATIAVAKDLAETHGFSFKTETVLYPLPETPV